MLTAVRTFLAILARRWPVLAAWYFGAEAAHYLLIHLAGWAASYTALGGLLLLPCAVLAKLVAYVAMYLVVRDDLPAVRTRTRRVANLADFAGTVTAAVLPFLVFYSAWGMLNRDLNSLYSVAADLVSKRHLGEESFVAGTISDVQFGWPTITVLLAAFAVRTVLSALGHRLPRWTGLPAAYVEVVWVGLLLSFIGRAVTVAMDWFGTRAGGVWLFELGHSLAQAVPWIGSTWDAVGGLWGLVGNAILLPVAWAAIAGVIYGERMDSSWETPAGSWWARVLDLLGRRVGEIADAVRLIWRAGPIAFGGFLVVFAVWTFAAATADLWALRVFGPQDSDFLKAFSGLLAAIVAGVFEPIRVAIVASAYDIFTAESSVDGESEPERVFGEGAGVHGENHAAVNVNRNQEADGGPSGPVI